MGPLLSHSELIISRTTLPTHMSVVKNAKNHPLSQGNKNNKHYDIFLRPKQKQSKDEIVYNDEARKYVATGERLKINFYLN